MTQENRFQWSRKSLVSPEIQARFGK